MKWICCIILILFVQIFCWAQHRTDSLKKLIRESELRGKSNNRAYLTASIAWEFSERKQYDSSLYYYYKAFKEGDGSDIPLLASTLNGIGVAYDGTGLFDSSVYYYNKALELYRQINDTLHVVILETNFSILYKNKGLYERSLESAFNALGILESRKPDRALASCYNTIGSVYALTGDQDKALIYYRKALSVRKDVEYIKGIAQSFNNIAEVFISMNLYDSALDNLSRSLEIKQAIGDVNGIANVLQNIGDVLLHTNKKQEAEKYLSESLMLKRKLQDRVGQVITLNSLGELKFSLGDLINAEKLLNESAILVNEIKALEPRRRNLELKVKLFKAKHDYASALQCAEQLFIVKDSLLSIEKAENLQAMQLRYETEKKEQEIQLLSNERQLQKAEIEAKRNWIRGLSILVMLALIIVVLTYNSVRLSNRGKRKVETLLRELHHRVKNNLQILSSVLSLQSQNLHDENAIQAIKSNEGRINAMALIHRKLYNEDQSRSVNIKDYVEELIQYLVHTYGYYERNLNLVVNIENIDVDVDKAIPLGLILNELISNVFKYAFIDQDNPELIVNLLDANNGDIQICVSDNGIGMTTSGEIQDQKTFGIKMVNALIKDLKGSYSVTNNQGTTYILHIPLT